MSLKYYDAANSIRQPNPKGSYYADYDAIVDFSFDNAPNVVYDEIEYEQTYGKNDFAKIGRVRVDTILEYNTGIILGDDYKNFIFPPEFDVTPFYGMKFRWKNSYWLVINTNSLASITNSAEVRRCNNVLRYFGKNGEKIYEPCIMDYTLRFANNEDTKMIIVGNGEQKVWCQRNDRTALIKPNQRFLFGTPEQRVSFRVYGGGTKNYLNGETMNDNSPTITEFYVDHYENNPLFDDFEEGFADAYLNGVQIEIKNESKTYMNVSDTLLLEAVVYRAGKIQPNVPIEWTSSKKNVVEVNDNIATAHKIGSCVITAKIVDTDISNSFDLSVQEEPVDDVVQLVVEPNIDYVSQNKVQEFAVYLYTNGVKMDDAVVFDDITDGVPNDKYSFVVQDANHFSIFNHGMYMNKPVIINCACGEYTTQLKIKLRGLY